MKYRTAAYLYSCLIIFALLSSCVQQKGADPFSNPNILIFLADDLGYGDLACYGHPVIQTPYIDQLASEGIRFTDFHSAGTVCSPSRASLLTGRHPYRSGFYYILGGGAHLTREEITVPSLLKNQGYQTFFAGKWHLTQFDQPGTNQPNPADHGFDYWFATAVNAFDGPESPEKFYRNGEALGELNDWYCHLIVDEAIQWLQQERNPDHPFFMEICSHEPHTPIHPPDDLIMSYLQDSQDLQHEINYGQVPRPDFPPNDTLMAAYYATVTQLDLAFGKLMKALSDLGLDEQTLVIFTSDNGPEYPVNYLESKGLWEDPIRDKCFGTPGDLRGMKRFTYEGGHRVPGIVRWPGKAPEAAVNHSLINGSDFMPTICDLVGIPLPTDRTIDGESVLKAFLGHEIERSRPLVWNAPVHEYDFIPPMVMRQDQYLLAAWFNEKDKDQLWMDWIKTAAPERYELYNLEVDVAQKNDISASNEILVSQMASVMDSIWKDIQKDAPVWPNWRAK